MSPEPGSLPLSIVDKPPGWNRAADLRAPFPWFGGKSRIAALVWERFGNVTNYVEPFFGSGAVLLGRPHEPGIETVNDLDCYLSNFWRALQHDPDEVTKWADSPVNEADLHARHLWLVNRVDFREAMKTDPDFYDAKIAGWWVWGLSSWIASGWCTTGSLARQMPQLSSFGHGVHRKLLSLSGTGQGVHRKLISLDSGRGIRSERAVQGLERYMRGLAERLRYVRVCCGDWSRICGPCPTTGLGLTGVFLDPPYLGYEGCYSTENVAVADDVREWAVAAGKHPLMRIALCGYEGQYQMPDDWQCVPWKAIGGYSSTGTAAAENARRERVWFSPHCLEAIQTVLPLEFSD